jgi:hypothetical protein
MIIMANVVCHDGYCESILNRDDSSKMTFGDKAIIGGLVLVAIAALAFSLYGVSLGYYPVPMSL